MRIMANLDVTGITNAFTTGSLPTGFTGSGCNTLYVINMSNFCYDIVFETQQQQTGHIPSSYARPFKIKGACDRYTINAVNNPTNTTLPSFSHIVIESYLESEDTTHLADTAIPVLPPAASSTVTIAQVLQNDGSPANTTFIESTPAGGAGSAVNAQVDGELVWRVLIAGVYHTVFTVKVTGNPLVLGQSGDTSEVAGAFLVNQLLTALNGVKTNFIATSVDGSDQIEVNAASPQVVVHNDLQTNGNLDVNGVSAFGPITQNGAISLVVRPPSTSGVGLVVAANGTPTNNIFSIQDSGFVQQIWSDSTFILNALNGVKLGGTDIIKKWHTVNATLNNTFSLIAHGLGAVPTNVLGTEIQATVDATPGNLIYDPGGSDGTNMRVCWNAGATARTIRLTAFI